MCYRFNAEIKSIDCAISYHIILLVLLIFQKFKSRFQFLKILIKKVWFIKHVDGTLADSLYQVYIMIWWKELIWNIIYVSDKPIQDLKPKRKIHLFLEIQVTRKIFIRAAANFFKSIYLNFSNNVYT